MKKIFEILKESFLKGFKGGFNLSRYGKLKDPKPEMLINKNHKSLAESIFDTSCMTLNETGIMYPSFFLIKKNQFTPVILDPESLEETDIQGYASMVTNIADDQDADAMFFISEQWRVKRKLTDEEIKEFDEGKKIPSLDPDRQEILCLVYLTSKGEMRSLIGAIERGIDNTPFVRESKWSNYQGMNANNPTLFQPWR